MEMAKLKARTVASGRRSRVMGMGSGKSAVIKIRSSQIDNPTPEAPPSMDSSIVSVNTFSFGGKITRNNLEFHHEGEHITSNLNGISVIGDNQHVDNHTLVHHKYENCESHELYKGIFDERATGVFNGKVIVNKEAQKTNAFQQNDNILIGDKASINTKPQLEIFADDVKCSHGCTIGQLDERALFYMQSRGIPEKEAKGLMLFAFCNEVVEKIRIPALKSRIIRLLAEKLDVELDLDV